MNPLASIDIGSNTIRMVIMELNREGSPSATLSKRAIVRLGEGMDVVKRILPHRMDQAIEVLRGFLEICRKRNDLGVRAVATSAVREAENRNEFLERVRLETGLTIDIIPWEEEARLTQKGVFWKIQPVAKRTLIFDIGGGSTEFILSDGSNVLGSFGTLLGVVRLTERFISRHPTDAAEYSALKSYLRNELARVKKALPLELPEEIIGTSGTVTTLSAIYQNVFPYSLEKIHGSILQLPAIQSIQENLKKKSLAERLEIKCLERGREDLIISGAAIVLETLDTFGLSELKVSEYGLREGVIIDQWRQK